jgi:uncharacterized protein YndB with AHSA1/START domain
MPDILHDFPVRAPVEQTWAGITSPEGLDAWWTARSAGHPEVGSEYQLLFEPNYDWRAVVTVAVPHEAFELRMTRSDADWDGTRVGVRLEARGGVTWVGFYHAGWQEANEHYRISSCCWAMYLRILRRWLEHGERVPYAERLDA